MLNGISEKTIVAKLILGEESAVFSSEVRKIGAKLGNSAHGTFFCETDKARRAGTDALHGLSA